MFVLDLLCDAGHPFEGWFDRADDADDALASGHVTCPVCGDVRVSRRPSFAAIGRSRPAAASTSSRASAQRPPAGDPSADAPAEPARPQLPLEVQKFLSHVLKQVRAHGEDVGERFAEVARAIHRGDEEERLVYGQATSEEGAALVDEGIPFAAIPIPDIDEN